MTFDYWGKVNQRMINEHLADGEYRSLRKIFRVQYRELNPPSPIEEERWIYSNIMRVVHEREAVKLKEAIVRENAGRVC